MELSNDEKLASEWIKNNFNLYLRECSYVVATHAFIDGRKSSKPQWHKLDWENDYPNVDKLVRVRTFSGAEYICKTYSYFPAEDEIGYGSVITQFSELNGDWVDDNEIQYWCEIEPFEEK